MALLALKGLCVQHPVPVAVVSRLGAPAARWVYLIAWMTIIFLASSDSASGPHSSAIVDVVIQLLRIEPSPAQVEVANHLFRKAAHFTEYGILGLLWAWALKLGPYRLMLAWGATTLYAASDECHQMFVANRGPSPFDVLIDSAGAATAVSLLRLFERRSLTSLR